VLVVMVLGLCLVVCGLLAALFASWLYHQPVPQQARWEASLVCGVMIAAGGLIVSAGIVLFTAAAGVEAAGDRFMTGCLLFLGMFWLARYLIGPRWARRAHRLDPTPVEVPGA